MQGERWREIERVLDAVLDRDPAEWPALLDAYCRDDPALRGEVEALLRRYPSARTFLATPPGTAAAALVDEALEVAPGTRIGPWRVIRQIGQGGTARVFLGERADGQFTQRVALKLLRREPHAEPDDRAFRRERQILASLDHPGIARLFDGGVTPEGQPWLAMELVEGEPLDRHCETGRLTLRARLELFLAVAEALHYAHRSLVVHRDLKPSNILVSADGRVRLLDFGLARLLEARPGEGSPAAPTTRRWMTPDYAAPEQVRGEPVTTLTDVYQLGAVLYQLVTGRVPFNPRDRVALAQAILDEEPAPPSATSRELRGDLDAIVLKAIRKEPAQRYPSVQAFAEDVRRHLTGHAVLARRQSAAYQARRFARRHPLALVGAAGLLLGAGAYSTTVSVQRARVEQALARATTEAHTASQVTELMLGMFETSEGGRAFGDTVSARELLRRAVARADEMTGEPQVRAEMLDLIARMYAELGDSGRVRALREEALAIRRTGTSP